MKNFMWVATAILIATVNDATRAAEPPAPAAATAQDALLPAPAFSSNAASQTVAPEATPKGISPEAWAHIRQQVEEQTYAVHRDPRHPGSLLAQNSAQHLSVRFAKDGVSFTADTRADKRMRGPSVAATPVAAPLPVAAPFRLRSHLDGTAAQSVRPVAAGNRVEYRHAAYTEWYVNDAKGFEQGWTVDAPLRSKHAAHIRIDVSGARTVAEGDDSVRIEDEHGGLRYRYAGLKAWDADHRSVPATLRRTGTGNIDVSFDDRGARYPITVDPTLTSTQEAVLSRSAGGFGSFPGSVAVDGDTVVVGAYAGGNGSGQVFIFSRNQNSSGNYSAGAWGLVSTLNDPYATANDYFGSEVAIQGDTIAVTGLQPGNPVRPALYIFERNLAGFTWAKAFTYVGTAQQAGFTVAVYGNTVVIGAAGSVVVLDRNAGGKATWAAAATLTDPQNLTDDAYGASVAVNGSTLVVGAYTANNYQGRAYVYSPSPGTYAWSLSATLSATSTNYFGLAVAVSGDTVVIGCEDGAFIYGRNQGGVGSWGLSKKLTDPVPGGVDFFGYAVGVDGDFVVVGSPPAQGSPEGGTVVGGAAYAYARNAGGAGMWGLAATVTVPSVYDVGTSVGVSGDTWIIGSDSNTAYIDDLHGGSSSAAIAISDPVPAAQDYFANSVSVSGDTLVTGSCHANSNKGAAYIFERNQGSAGSWGLAATLADPAATSNDYFGCSVSVDGDTLAVGAYGTKSSAGAVYVYGRNQGGSGTWGQVQALAGSSSGEQLGASVAVNGSTLVAGANGKAASGGQKAFVYESTGAGGWTSYASLAASNAGNYGGAVAVYGDTVMVGDSGYNSNEGAAYFYNRNQGGAEAWGLVTTIVDPAGASADTFGLSVAVNGSTAVVGAPGTANQQGKAYVYGYGNPAGNWALTATLPEPTAATSDFFGQAVAISGDAIVVGTPDRAENGTIFAGAVYVFNRNQGGSNAWGLIATQTDPSPAAFDGYGNAVAVDAETVAIGTSNKDTAYLLSIQQPTPAAKDASIVWFNSGQTVLWNMNGSTIASAPNLGTGPAGWSIVGTADFNGDGSPDVLWRNTSGAVVIWFTNGSTVTSSLNLGTVPTTWTVSGTGDFNGDGNSDILWRNSNGDTVIWYMNGSGIASSSDLSTVPTTWTIAGTGDFDGDGNADILWRNSNGDTVIWFIKGGAINSSADLGVIPAAWSVAGTGDFNGDGHRDILWRNTNGDVVIWFMNGGTISSSSDLGVVASTWSIDGVGDFNGDGKDDILWRNSNGDTVIWFMNGGTITSTGDLGVVATGWNVIGVSEN